MSIFFTDIIDIVRISVDEWGAETKTITSNVPARVDDKVKLIRDKQGQDVMSNFWISLDKSTLIDYNDKIKIKKRAGKELDATFQEKEWAIVSLTNSHGFKNHHMELVL